MVQSAKAPTKNPSKLLKDIRKYMPFYIMFLPVGILFLVIAYLPMIGTFLAFTDYSSVSNELTFIGFDNFKDLLTNSRFLSAFKNTLFLSIASLCLGTLISVTISILLNELRDKNFKKSVQTIIYLPHFMSWVVVASIFTIILSPQGGAVNQLLARFNIDPIYFMGSTKWWTPIYLFVVRWKETGWATIIYLAALTSISPDLYEAAMIDGANRFQQVLHITIPSIMTTILVVFVLNLARVMNLFESVFVLQNDIVLSKAEVIATYVFKVGIRQADYGYSTAVGLFRSAISLILVLFGNYASKKIKGETLL